VLIPQVDPWKTLLDSLDKFEPNFRLERDQPNAVTAGVRANQLRILDAATHRVKTDLDEMNAILDSGQRRATAFFAEIERLKRPQRRKRS
jgi:hypothetical protein